MAIGTAFPNADPTVVGSWAAYNNGTVVAFGSADAYLADSSDSTWVQCTAVPTSSRANMNMAFEDVVTGGSVIGRIRPAARLQSSGVVTVAVLSGGSELAALNTTAAGASPVAYFGGWVNPPASGGTSGWSTATLNAATLYCSTPSTNLRFVQLRVEYDLVSTPSVGTVVATPLTTDRPTISWTYSDADSGAQSSAVVKVFSSAVFSGTAFNADTSTSLYSTVVAGAGTSIVPDTAIGANGLVFRAYVKTVSDKFTVPVTSAWQNSVTQTLAFTPIGAPTVSVSWDDTFKRAAVTVVGSASPYRYTVTRSGATIGTALDTMPTSGSVVLYDYTAPRGTAVVYTATITAAGTAPQITSPEATGTVTTTNATSWELRSLDAPMTYYITDVPVAGVSWTQYEGVQVFRPLGSRRPVVVSGDLHGDDGNLAFTTSSRLSWETVKSLVDVQGELLLTSPFRSVSGVNDAYIIRLTSRDWVSEGTLTNPVQRLNVGFVETDYDVSRIYARRIPMAVKHNRISVGTAATELNLTETDSQPGQQLVASVESGTVFLGGSAVSSTSYGFVLTPGIAFASDLSSGEKLFAAAASGSVTVNVIAAGA